MGNITKELVRRELFECIQKEVGWVMMVMVSRRFIKPISYIFCDYNLCGYLLSLCLNAVCSNDNNSDYLVGR